MITVEYRIYKGQLYLDKGKRAELSRANANVVELVQGTFDCGLEKMLDPEIKKTCYRSTCNLTGVTVRCNDKTAKALFLEIFGESSK